MRVDDTIVTSGWSSPRLSSLYPRGIRIGRVTSVGRTDTDLYTQVQVTPFADLSSLEAVLVLIPVDRGRGHAVSVALRIAPLVFVAAIVQVTVLGRCAHALGRARPAARHDRLHRARRRLDPRARRPASPAGSSST